MKKSKQVILITGITMSMFFAGCSSVPQEEIDEANAAIEFAKTAGAVIYSPDSFSALQDSMMVAMEMVEAGKSKLIKNFNESREMLEKVTIMAGEVKTETDNRIEELKKQVQATVEEVNILIKENNQLVSEAPRGKEGTSALTAIRNEIAMIESSITEVGVMYENGNYLGANDRAIAAKEKAVSINSELKEVIAKYKKAAGSR